MTLGLAGPAAGMKSSLSSSTLEAKLTAIEGKVVGNRCRFPRKRTRPFYHRSLRYRGFSFRVLHHQMGAGKKKLQFASGIVKLVSLAIISIIDLARRCEKKCSHGPTGLTLFPKVVNDDRAQFTCSIYSARRMGQRGETAPITARKKSVAQFSLHPPLAAPSRGSSLRTPIGARRKSPSLKQI